MDSQTKSMLIGGAIGAFSSLSLYCLAAHVMKPAGDSKKAATKGPDSVYVLLGDVGATNVRLELKRLHLTDKARTELIKSDNFDAQALGTFEEAVKNFLKVLFHS